MCSRNSITLNSKYLGFMKINSYTHPAEVFKAQADKEAEIKFWQELQTIKLPVYKKCENIRLSVGWINLLKQLKP